MTNMKAIRSQLLNWNKNFDMLLITQKNMNEHVWIKEKILISELYYDIFLGIIGSW